MDDGKAGPIDQVIDDLKRALQRCDEADIGQKAALHIDLALQLAIREKAILPRRD